MSPRSARRSYPAYLLALVFFAPAPLAVVERRRELAATSRWSGLRLAVFLLFGAAGLVEGDSLGTGAAGFPSASMLWRSADTYRQGGMPGLPQACRA